MYVIDNMCVVNYKKSIFCHHSFGDNLHPMSPLKTLFRGKFVLRNEYLLESVQVVLFRIGAKIVIF